MYFTQAAVIAAMSATGASAAVLDLSMFQKVWTSELDHQSFEDAETSFATENAFMTNELAFSASDASDELVSSILCNHSSGNSGYNRAQQIQQSFPNSNLSVLYNKAEMSCFLAALPSSVFADNAMHVLDSWTVTPLTSYMKIRAGSVEGIESAHESAEDFKSISFTVCLAATEEQESAEIADGILTRIQARDEQGRSLATEKFHWTRSDVEHDRRLSRTHHTRIARWRQAMEEGINAEHQCQSLFDEIETLPTSDENEFLFTMGHGDIGDPSSSASAHCMLSLVASLAAQPEVCSVENLPQNKEVNDIAQWITQSYQKDYRPFWDAGLLGEGQVVQVSDSGLDTNNCYFWDEGGEVVKDKSQTVDNSRRKVVQYYAYKDGVALTNDHGTHVTGSVMGHRATDGINESTGQADGTGRDAKVAFFDIGLGAACCYVPGADTLFGPGKVAGAKIHSASWGSSSASYTSSARDFDNYIHKNDDFLVLVAAGNSGNGNKMESVGSPATAKNIIAVGASNSGGRDLFNGGEKYLAYFSSRGPTTDGRLKPDVVAPGFQILSSAGIENQIGECDNGNIPGWSSQSGGLSFKSGTSMATPVTSGNAAIVRQYLTEGWYPSGTKVTADAIEQPPAALMKAIILNGGQSLTGVYQSNGSVTPVSEYDNNQGFGLTNMLKSLPLAGKNDISMKLVEDATTTTNQNDQLSFEIEACDSTDEISATLVWTDPPGVSGCSECLINDLDLTLSKSGTVYYPNGGTDKDVKNNAERVRIKVNTGDTVTVSVRGTNISTQSQKYSLVVTGCLGNSDKAPTTPFPTKSPTENPTQSPTISSKPTMYTGDLQPALQTTVQGGNGSNGNMFDLVSKTSDIFIHSFDVVEQKAGNEFEVMFYTKAGSHVGFETDEKAWDLIGTTTITSKGTGNRVPIGNTVFDSVSIKAGETQAFYVTFPEGSISYTNGNNLGTVYQEDDHLQFLEGTGLPHGFTNVFFPARIFNGAIIYSVLPAVTAAPSDAPSYAPVAATDEPTATPSDAPTGTPKTPAPVADTDEPTATPSDAPTGTPKTPAPVAATDEPTATPSDAPTGISKTPAPVATSWLYDMLKTVNNKRAEVGAPSLCYNDKLIAAAQVHTKDMVDNEIFSHTGSDDSTVGTRVTSAGYAWNGVAENIAKGQTTVEDVMTAWMDSAGHKANILNSSHEHFGVAEINKVWTQVFGYNNNDLEVCSSTFTPAPTPSPSSGPTDGKVATPAPVSTVTPAPTPSPSSGPTSAPVVAKSVYEEALEMLKSISEETSREEKNSVIKKILSLMESY